MSDVSNLGEWLQMGDRRRTIYQPVIRTLEPDVLQLFDSANNAMVTGSRPRTIVAPQALYFMNSRFVHQSAEQIASLAHPSPSKVSPATVVDALFDQIVGRAPTKAERMLLIRYLRGQADGPPGLTTHDIMKLAQAILGSTQFQFLE